MDARARDLEELYAARYVSFRNALATVTGSRESARDAVQEAFARALAQRESYRDEGPLAAWVWKIALRVALENRRRPHPLPLEESVDPALLEPERDPELAAALRRLSPRRRLIVFLRYFGVSRTRRSRRRATSARAQSPPRSRRHMPSFVPP
jgi:DNA-directed RNA polymerase specialized sigma24 family protein